MKRRWRAEVAIVVAAAALVGCEEKKDLVAPAPTAASPAASKGPEPKPPPE